MLAPTRMAYWLLPKEPELTKYRSIVLQLASEFGAPKFDPHITVYSGPYDLNDPLEKIQKVLSSFGPLELAVKGLRFSDKFTQSCFIEFEESDRLVQMRNAVLDSISSNENPDHFPHMSLIYGDLTSEGRSLILDRVVLPENIYFDSVRIVASRGKTQTREDVEYWHSMPFG